MAGAELEVPSTAAALLLAGGASAATVRYAGRGTAAAVLAALGSAAATFCWFFTTAFVAAILRLF